MWQLVFVAAVAGSSILVKHLFRNDDKGGDHHPVRVSSVSEQKEEKLMEVQRKEEEEADSWMSEKLLLLHPVVAVVEDEGSSSIFRFTGSSSSSLEPGGEGGRSGSRSSGIEEDNSVKRRRSSSIGEKKMMILEEEEDQRNKGIIRRRRNVSFCLKRRRTCKIPFRKSGSFKEESKGNSLFSCGVGFGFMLSARKAEFNKLTAVDIEETTQVTITSCKDGANMETMGMNKEVPLLMMTDLTANLATPNDPEVLDLSSNGDGECPSSILTEEVDLEALEMDRLEAELESELQKIPDEDDPEYFMDFPSTELSADALEEGPQEPLGMDQNSSQFYGVLPTELDRKLCHVLIKQQESQIAELESNLYLSQMKLREKDAELRKLKAVVCSLRDFSLETASDDEAEDCVILDEVEEEKEMKSNADSLIYPRSDDDGSNKIIVVVKEQKKSLCGVKRLMEFESYANCQVNHNALVS